MVCSVVLRRNVITWCIDEVENFTQSHLSTTAIAMMLVCIFLYCFHFHLIMMVLVSHNKVLTLSLFATDHCDGVVIFSK